MAFDKNDPADVALVQSMVDEAITGLKSKNDELMAEVRGLKRKSKDGVDHAELERIEAERDKALSELAAAQKASKDAAKAAEDAAKQLQSEQSYTSRLLVDNGLAAALAEAGVLNPVQAKAAAALIKSSAQIDVKVDGDKRAAVIGDKPLAEFVKGWAGGDEGKHFVAAQNNNGGGAAGSKPGAGGQQQGGNLGGSKEDRVAAINARFAGQLPQ